MSRPLLLKPTSTNCQHDSYTWEAVTQHFANPSPPPVSVVCSPYPTATVSTCTPAWRPGNWVVAVYTGTPGTSWQRTDDEAFHRKAAAVVQIAWRLHYPLMCHRTHLWTLLSHRDPTVNGNWTRRAM